MDAVFTILGVFFIGLMIAGALTFGFAVLTFSIAVAVVTALLITVRELFRRWIFVRHADKHTTPTVEVIEGEYKDITNQDK